VLADRGLYMRTDNNESALLRTSADFRLLIGRAVQNKSDELLLSMRAVLKGVPMTAPQASDQFEGQIGEAREYFGGRNPLPNKQFDYFFETAFVPNTFDDRRYDVPKLRQTAFEASVDYTGWPFLPIHVNRPDVFNVFADGIESFWYTDDYFGGKILDFWRLYQSGLFYKKEMPSARCNSLRSLSIQPWLNTMQWQWIVCRGCTRPCWNRKTRSPSERLSPAHRGGGWSTVPKVCLSSPTTLRRFLRYA
jgi:hypothetical protein